MADAKDWNLQPLFPEPILEQHLFPDVHPGQASYVWRVTTARERRIVRTSRLTAAPEDAFWVGCRELFGVQPCNFLDMYDINATLRSRTSLPIPFVVRAASLHGRSLLVVEELPGRGLVAFNDLPVDAAAQLGCGIAEIHGATRDAYGDFPGRTAHPLRRFGAHMASVMEHLLNRFYHDSPEFQRDAPRWMEAAATLPAPACAVPILLDMDPTQFLTDGERLTGLVDTELYAYGPAAYDLIALEPLLDRPHAAAFARGYQTVRPMPDLRPVRPVYRFLQRLMELQGPVPLDAWMRAPAWFDAVSA
ncbi:MAG: phosphotransferase [Alicyclobacillus sp.]|nr:phosphotransferase [Alicyclobacillus sp.]